MLKDLCKLVVNGVVVLPIATVTDVVTFPLIANGDRKSMINKTLENMSDNVENIVDSTIE